MLVPFGLFSVHACVAKNIEKEYLKGLVSFGLHMVFTWISIVPPSSSSSPWLSCGPKVIVLG
jgi:hypothetical protein